MDLQLITNISLAVIGLVFAGFIWSGSRVARCAKIIKKAFGESDSLEALKDTKLSQLVESYRKSINININAESKTNIPAGEYFSEFTVCKANGINAKMLDAGSGTLVGLGLLGTFLGLTLGIQGFDSSNSENIQSSIQSLLDGMGTAFLTSLLGMACSLLYTVIEKALRNGLCKSLHDFNEKLDAEYYVDDIELSKYNQETLTASFYDRVKELINAQSTSIVGTVNEQGSAIVKTVINQSTYTNGDGVEVSTANAIREILTNNEEQTRALKSFSSDLAIELNNGFDEVLSRQMQQKILPLMESVDATTKSVVEHIDSMAAQVSSPATDMIEQVVDELKTAMNAILAEFKSSLSDNATKELENLALSLSTATSAMGRLPKDMENISDTLQVTIDEVKRAVAEIANSSAASSTSAMTQMQEQITFATTAINNAIMEVKDVMTGITKSSQQSTNDVVEKLTKASEQMASFLDTTVGQISTTMSGSMQSLAAGITAHQDKLNSSQNEMLETIEVVMNSMTEQSEKSSQAVLDKMSAASDQMASFLNDTVKQISYSLSSAMQTLADGMTSHTGEMKSSQEELLAKFEALVSRFNEGINRVDNVNESVAGTMNTFRLAQGEITTTTSHLQSISSDMRTATELFRKSQTDFNSQLSLLQGLSKDQMQELLELLKTAGATTEEYAQKFEVIRNGLAQIFGQLQTGLNQYSTTVRESIQRYLDAYSKNLTETTGALASTIQQQNEMVEMLVDTVNRKR